MNKSTVLVVDDHPFFRRGIIHWIGQQPGLTCCGEAESIAATRRILNEQNPDFILLDLHLPDGDGLDFIAELGARSPQSRIIVLSQCDEEVYAHRALRAGARSYVMKSEAADSLAQAIETVMQGGVYVSRVVSARLLHNLFPDPRSKDATKLAALSDRELQVFQLLGGRMNVREIAEMLKISTKTVETYREHLKNKLGVSTAGALVREAISWVDHGTLSSPKTPEFLD